MSLHVTGVFLNFFLFHFAFGIELTKGNYASVCSCPSIKDFVHWWLFSSYNELSRNFLTTTNASLARIEAFYHYAAPDRIKAMKQQMMEPLAYWNEPLVSSLGYSLSKKKLAQKLMPVVCQEMTKYTVGNDAKIVDHTPTMCSL